MCECLCSSETQPGFHARCVYCSLRFNSTLYIYVKTTQSLTPLMLERSWWLVQGGSVCLCLCAYTHVCVEGNFCTVLLVEEEPVDGGGGDRTLPAPLTPSLYAQPCEREASLKLVHARAPSRSTSFCSSLSDCVTPLSFIRHKTRYLTKFHASFLFPEHPLLLSLPHSLSLFWRRLLHI